MNFIELTSGEDNKKRLINPKYIIDVKELACSQTEIYVLSCGDKQRHFTVNESFEKVDSLLKALK